METNIKALLNLGECFTQLQEYDRFIEYCNRVITLEVSPAVAYRKAAIAYDKKGDLKNSLLYNIKAYRDCSHYYLNHETDATVLVRDEDVSTSELQTSEISKDMEDLLYSVLYGYESKDELTTSEAQVQKRKLYQVIKQDLARDIAISETVLADEIRSIGAFNRLLDSHEEGMKEMMIARLQFGPYKHSTPKEKSCVVMSVVEMHYDNPLLNNPLLVQEFANKFGAGEVSKLIDITCALSTDLREEIDEICQNTNAIDMLGMLIGFPLSEAT